MKKILASTAALAVAFASQSAFAQDAAAFEGPYVGATVGGGVLDTQFVDGYEDFTYGSANKTAGTFVFGVNAGYNTAVGSNGVLGLEVDFNGSTAKAKQDFNDWESHIRQSVDWFSTVRARAGLATGNTLIYATGGVAFVRNDNKAYYYSDEPCGTYDDEACSKSTDTGLVLGAGAEMLLGDNLSLKAEYLHINGATKNVQGWAPSYDYEYVSFKNDLDIARIGFNYHF